MNTRFLLVATVCLAALPALSALKFYEPFDYPTGRLSQVSGSVWWDTDDSKGNDTNGWFETAPSGNLTADSLTYIKNGTPLIVQGQCAVLRKLVGGSVTLSATRSLTNALSPDGLRPSSGTCWMSWLMTCKKTGTSWGGTYYPLWRRSGSENDWGNGRVALGYENENSPGCLQPNDWLQTFSSGLNTSNHADYTRETPGNTVTAWFMVVKLDFDNTNATYYINPEPGAADPAVGADWYSSRAFYTDTGADMMFDEVKLFHRWQSLSGLLYLDELRVGDTYHDVAPVPEPLCLGGLAALALLLSRSHR
jgi:hypothetical protein